MARPTIPAHVREQQINDLPNIRFVRWLDGEYRNAHSKAVCRCDADHEWSASVNSLLNHGKGCPHCAAGKKRRPPSECIDQINALPNITFARWVGGKYHNAHSKAVCRCTVDGFEWSASVSHLLNDNSGCPQCATLSRADKKRRSLGECIAQINELPNIRFVRWQDGEYRNQYSKVVCHCTVDGHEWSTSVTSLLNQGTGCPQCAKYGYNPSKPGTLYALRSECGTMVKIGISNNTEQRHAILKRKTPFAFECVELCHGDGAMVATLEKVLHGLMEPVVFDTPFDGSTEWRKWDARLPEWFDLYRSWS